MVTHDKVYPKLYNQYYVTQTEGDRVIPLSQKDRRNCLGNTEFRKTWQKQLCQFMIQCSNSIHLISLSEEHFFDQRETASGMQYLKPYPQLASQAQASRLSCTRALVHVNCRLANSVFYIATRTLLFVP
ncbi:hypothetical protein KQX54_012226 [Cotesia glomerata]|uniref:Uncharacterized protein n=1 Tax=Cotesia glomerata TaxID=32391 RepID=A0AAV7J7M5_COTGL|nr:hypothetical protein KQX54_012226 [Cotesia glomerata]